MSKYDNQPKPVVNIGTTTPPTPDAGRARTIIEKWRAEMPHLVQPESWMQPMIALLDAYDAMADERNGLAFAQQHLTAQLAAANDAFDTVMSVAPVYCEHLHHTKKEYHKSGEPCPVEARIKALDAALAVQP